MKKYLVAILHILFILSQSANGPSGVVRNAFQIMFTGLVETVAEVVDVQSATPGKRLVLALGPVASGVRKGDSIAINGCCLTAIDIQGQAIAFEAGPETLFRTNLGALEKGSRVNIERSLKIGDPCGGHFVTGHIDAVGRVESREQLGDWSTFWFSSPPSLTRQMVSKGSIAIDGVSLTLVEVTPERFSVQLIPHTLAATTLGSRQPGDAVNLETDLLAKYVEKQLNYRHA